MRRPVFALSGVLTAGACYLAGRRTWHTARDLSARCYPSFVFRELDADSLGIPVFTYHSIAPRSTPDSVTPQEFKRHMRYLAENGYHTLTADELHAFLATGSPVPPRSVMITFDDGRATVWTMAFPILHKYNLRAVCFLVPSTMSENGVRPNLADHDAGHVSSQEAILGADMGDTPAITWREARIMHDGGLIDFQSHTLDHTLIFCSPEIVDFCHPNFGFGYNHYGVPALRCDGVDRLHHRPPLGTPIYGSQPRMSAARRFLDDEGLRHVCVTHVDQHGGSEFFKRSDWKADLLRIAQVYRQQHNLDESFETPEEQAQAIRHSLQHSKRLIETYLPGHVVRHLSYPWHAYSLLAASLAREIGYVSAFIAINPQKLALARGNPYRVQRTLPTNTYGDDPYQIARFDARDDLILSLPGDGRLTYTRRVTSRLLRTPGFLGGGR